MARIADGNAQNPYTNAYIISACSFAYEGLSRLLAGKGIDASRVVYDADHVKKDELDVIFRASEIRIYVFLQGDVSSVLSTLKKLVFLLNYSHKPVSVLILCSLPLSWLYRMLLSLVYDKDKISAIRVAGSSLTCHEIVQDDFHLLEVAARMEERLTGSVYNGLSSRELDAVLSFYRGVPVKVQSRRLGLADKTIYTHRHEGLRKMQFIQRWLNDAKMTRDLSRNIRDSQLSKIQNVESVFNYDIESKGIFPVYQVITNRKKQATGFEILLRWRRNGRIQKPAEFLTHLNNKNTWLKLTALVLDAAVRGINKYNGKYFFSVNIPPELSSGDALPGMAKKAVELLHQPEWADRLVFEFAESIDVTKDPRIPVTMNRIRQIGCRLVLDDCFSNDHVMFPVRHVHFDGLKLDKDLVDKFGSNESDCSLIKAILYYSEMTETLCTAEGVDSEDKFETLIAMGVNSFQGFYLSEPVKEAEMDRMVRQFS